LKGGSGSGAPLSMEALSGQLGWGYSFVRGPEDYERKALGTGISAGATWSGLIYRDFEI